MTVVDNFELERHEADQREFVAVLDRHTPFEGSREVAAGLRLARASHPTDRLTGVFKPSLCIVAQGAKEFYIGSSSYRYDAERYMISTVQMPMTGRVVEASALRPYLSIRLELEPSLVGSVMVDSGLSSPSDNLEARAVFLSRVEHGLLSAVVRMVRLLDTPDDQPALLPLLKREIVYRLLNGEQGSRLRHLPMMGAHSHRIAKAVEKLRKDFDQQLSIEGLARELGMSPSGFHHHFKTVMEMSPLQFQKLIRLQEARQLMLGENLDASSASYRVGYEDPSHFSRDYKKQFGDAPIRDVGRLRQLVAAD